MDGRGNVDHAAPGCLSHPTDTLRLEAGRGDSGGIRLYGALHLALVLLQHEGRLTYRTLMQLCGLDQALMAAVRDELLFKRVARDEHGQGLVWRDEASAGRASPRPHGRR